MPKKKKLTHETENDILAVRLRGIMAERNISQDDLGKAIGKQRQTIGTYTTGQSKPDSESVARIAQFFDVSADWLLGISDSRSSNADIREFAKITGLSEIALNQILIANQIEQKELILMVNCLFENLELLLNLSYRILDDMNNLQKYMDIAKDCSFDTYTSLSFSEYVTLGMKFATFEKFCNFIQTVGRDFSQYMLNREEKQNGEHSQD